MAEKTKIDSEKSVIVPKTPSELQKLKLEKLMKNPTKEVFIPEPSQERKPRDPLEFIRNVWGSSAGAGSGDFHVYRGVRRREYARQKYLDEKFAKDNADVEYQKKLEENQRAAEEKTAKKREKRKKKKQKQKGKRQKKEEKSDHESEEEIDDGMENSDITKDNNSEESAYKGDKSDTTVLMNKNKSIGKEHGSESNGHHSDSSSDNNET